MTKDEKNRAIAKWLGLTLDGLVRYHTTSLDGASAEHSCVPDFYRSEEANALLRNKLASINGSFQLMRSNWPGSEGWNVGSPVYPQGAGPRFADPLEAISEAALRLIEMEKP